MKTKSKQKLPKWFNGELYEKGAVVQNRFGGAEIELNNIELSMYDFIMEVIYYKKNIKYDKRKTTITKMVQWRTI